MREVVDEAPGAASPEPVIPAPAAPLPWLYRGASRLPRPRSFAGKLFVIAFLSTHVPLLTLIGYLIVRGGTVSTGAVLLVTLVATLLGTGLVLWALHQLLAPVLLADGALEAYLTSGTVTPLPTRYGDEAGRLLRNVAFTLAAFRGEREQRVQLVQQATQDSLTGLLNRRGAEEQLRRTLAQVARDGRPHSVALVDVDTFKQVNDRGGHLAGDQLLAALGQLFATGLRPSDWAARLGGDEFLLMLDAPVAEAVPVLERLRVLAGELRIAEGTHDLGASISMGLTLVLPEDVLVSCLHRADGALYEAKHAGRNRLVLAEPTVPGSN